MANSNSFSQPTGKCDYCSAPIYKGTVTSAHSLGTPRLYILLCPACADKARKVRAETEEGLYYDRKYFFLDKEEPSENAKS